MKDVELGVRSGSLLLSLFLISERRSHRDDLSEYPGEMVNLKPEPKKSSVLVLRMLLLHNRAEVKTVNLGVRQTEFKF